MRIKLLLLTCVFSAAALLANATDEAPPCNGGESKKSDIAGGVVDADSKKPLNNVNVVVYSGNKKEKVITTDAQGNYNFDDLKPGTYKLVFEKTGYRKV